ncbi:MerR family transcriptional regulator [Parageobacillus thermoglucosidasius]|uniref:MerR family transcriptional regulator n=1 Tax=Parageobacillus thermoglucosidasius TaxID=1426 RepID=UPI000E17EB4B|nr:MerR family transcriptional regulator [Parageobacillus thermoglucosidasius]RDE36247.1 MerR family transcriptional regulator [Parageobacillus thermoglucosidasius]
MELKTSTVAKRLGVSPKTIQRWVKKYHIPCQKNEAGHYVFDAETISLLEQIKFEHGTALEQRDSQEPPNKTSAEALFTVYNQFASRLQHIEHQLDQKADDVVSVQLLQHRQEIEELASHLHKLEQRIAKLEENAHKEQANAAEKTKKKAKRRGLGHFMSLFT